MSDIANGLERLERRIKAAFAAPEGPSHDRFILMTLTEALTSAKEGNFGVGAVLVADDGEVIQKGRNRVFSPFFRSDRHAEMDVLTSFEERFKSTRTLGDAVLFSSLEPCPMCLTRLITCGVGKVYYGARDEPGGMVTRMADLPPEWIHLAEGRIFVMADCSPELSRLALDVFQATVDRNDQRLKERSRRALSRQTART
jgi:cytosine deaminase